MKEYYKIDVRKLNESFPLRLNNGTQMEFDLCPISDSVISNAFARKGYKQVKGLAPVFLMTPVGKSKGNEPIRVYTILKVKNNAGRMVPVLFYTSSGAGGKGIAHGWYPVFGIKNIEEMGYWIMKTNGSEMSGTTEKGNPLPYGSETLGRLKKFLDDNYPLEKFIEGWRLQVYRFKRIWDKAVKIAQDSGLSKKYENSKNARYDYIRDAFPADAFSSKMFGKPTLFCLDSWYENALVYPDQLVSWLVNRDLHDIAMDVMKEVTDKTPGFDKLRDSGHRSTDGRDRLLIDLLK